MLKEVYALLTGGRCVWVQDGDGETKKLIARKNPWGEWEAYWYPGSAVKGITLMPDGTCQVYYPGRWKFCYPTKPESVLARIIGKGPV